MMGLQWAYWALAVAWSGYQGARGIADQQLHSGTPWFDQMRPWRRFWFLYLHDFAFRFICAFAGFVALAVVHLLAQRSVHDMNAGEVTVLISSFLLGIVGVGGQLPYVIMLGKVPRP